MNHTSLVDKLSKLHLSTLATCFESFANKNPDQANLLAPLLEDLVDEELKSKEQRRIHRCIHGAQFVRIQTIDTFNFNYSASTKSIKKKYLLLFMQTPSNKA